eukprot:1104215-Rhodomonas_salina.7
MLRANMPALCSSLYSPRLTGPYPQCGLADEQSARQRTQCRSVLLSEMRGTHRQSRGLPPDTKLISSYAVQFARRGWLTGSWKGVGIVRRWGFGPGELHATLR